MQAQDQPGQELSTAVLANPQHSTAPSQSGPEAGTQVETRTSDAGEGSVALFAEDEASNFRSRWTDIQSAFVDDPRQAVEKADGLVAEVMQRLAQLFADERSTLESQWESGQDISTEDLRVALQRYRSFFDRLLSI